MSLFFQLKCLVRDTLGMLGVKKYQTRYIPHRIDLALEKYIDYKNGFFIELGANDGITQSNTWYLESQKGWKGVLVEPIPHLYEIATKRRKRSKVFNCACVSFDYPEPYIPMIYANLMSMVKGSMKTHEMEEEHLRDAVRVQPGVTPSIVNVPTKTLTSILDECLVSSIDLLSLDVEGYEADVLRGLDFDKYLPYYLLIEARFKEEVESVIEDKYNFVEQITEMDRLYRVKKI